MDEWTLDLPLVPPAVDESMGAASVLLQARTVGIAYIAVDMETRFHGQTLSHRASVQVLYLYFSLQS